MLKNVLLRDGLFQFIQIQFILNIPKSNSGYKAIYLHFFHNRWEVWIFFSYILKAIEGEPSYQMMQRAQSK